MASVFEMSVTSTKTAMFVTSDRVIHSRVAVGSLCYSPRVTQPLRRVTAGVMFVVVCAAPLMER